MPKTMHRIKSGDLRHLVGVDISADEKSCAYAVYDLETKEITELECAALDVIADRCRTIHDPCHELPFPGVSRAIIFVEDPNLDSTTFDLWREFQKKFRHMPIPEVKALYSKHLKVANSVGMCKGAAKLFLRNISELPIVRVAPSERHRYRGGQIHLYNRPTKLTQTAFRDWTGWRKRTNDDKRDAGALVFGKTSTWAVAQYNIQSQLTEDQMPGSRPRPKAKKTSYKPFSKK